MSEILVPVSFGELLDKIAILQIKSERMSDPDKLANVRNELSALEKTWMVHPAAGNDIVRLRAELKAVTSACGRSRTTSGSRKRRRNSTASSSDWRAASTSRTTSAPGSSARSTPRWARTTSRRSPTRTTAPALRPSVSQSQPASA